MEILFCNVQVHHLQFTFSIERPTYRNAPNLNLNSNDTTDWRITLVNRENRRKNAVNPFLVIVPIWGHWTVFFVS